jgi:MFS family permease
VLLLAAVLFINYIDRGVLSTAAPLLQTALHLSFTQLGMLGSAFFWTYSLVQVPVGWIAERYGAERVLTAGLILWATATMLLGLASSFWMLIALRLLLGVGESTGFPSVSQLLAAAVPATRLGTANGIVGFAYTFGPAVGTLAGGLLMVRFGWRSAFLVFGAASLLWLWPWRRVLRARAAASSATGPATRRAEASPPMRLLLRSRALWGTALGLFSSNYVFYFMMSWLPVYLVRARGFSETQMATLASASYAVMALSSVLAGWLVDRYIRRGGSANFGYKAIMAVAHGGAVLSMLAMAYGAQPLAVAGIFFYQAITGAACCGVYAIPEILGGAQATGRWVGIQNSIGNLPGVVAPWLTGFIIDATGEFTLAFLVAAAVSLVGLVGWLAMLPPLAEMDWEARAAAAQRPRSLAAAP